MKMPEDPKQPDAVKEPSQEFKKFESAMKQILSVTKEEALAVAEEKPDYPKRRRRK